MAAALQASESIREVYENGLQDGLTGCFNRTHAIDTLEGELRARPTVADAVLRC